jgi:hypothetical protein
MNRPIAVHMHGASRGLVRGMLLGFHDFPMGDEHLFSRDMMHKGSKKCAITTLRAGIR